jgi:hypothetical protein
MDKIPFSVIALAVSATLTATMALGQQPIPPAEISHEAPILPKEVTQRRIPHAARSVAPDEDIHAAFGLDGDDDKHISLSDATGVSLAPIQELNKRLREKDARIAALEGQLKSMNDAFSARLAKLEEPALSFPHAQATLGPTRIASADPSGQ